MPRDTRTLGSMVPGIKLATLRFAGQPDPSPEPLQRDVEKVGRKNTSRKMRTCEKALADDNDDDEDVDDDEEGWKGGPREMERCSAQQWVIKQAGIEKQREKQREREGDGDLPLFFTLPSIIPAFVGWTMGSRRDRDKTDRPPTSSHYPPERQERQQLT